MSDEAGPSRQRYEASPIDINDSNAIPSRSRRDSEYSTFGSENGDGTMFSGPGHVVNPSSVSRMSIDQGRRRSMEWSRGRRRSGDSNSRHQPERRRSSEVGSPTPHDVHSEAEEGLESGRAPISRHDTLEERNRMENSIGRGVFGGIAHLFSGSESAPSRRPSSSRRRSGSWSHSLKRQSSQTDSYAIDSDSEVERWGYTSGEEDSVTSSPRLMIDTISITDSMAYDSEPPSPKLSQSFPLLTSDHIFGGETRIDVDAPFEGLDAPPPGPPTRQLIYIPDEDSTIRLVGYEIVKWRQLVWRCSCFLSLGIVGLLGHWFPRLWLRWVTEECAFLEMRDGFIAVESTHRGISLLDFRVMTYPYHLSSVFEPLGEPNGRYSLPSSSELKDSTVLGKLSFIDYRYSRFILDPRTGVFVLLRDWRDRDWTSIRQVQTGLDDHTRRSRRQLFGSNEINIEAKSTISLLLNEVIHPFYVFQIASVVLWSLDDYYYYAFCIAFISMISITTTLLETKKTMARMREMSRFSCRVDVLIRDSWVECDSSDLVPGDVVNLSTSQLSTIPCDMFLLSGDAIVNESMLTGESVPVSKVPVKDEELLRWKAQGQESATKFLYSGTKAVRIRGGFSADAETGPPALGLVARTGFYTTKGALVRSMLFPKPVGFKFYQDSLRFISVLALIACLGFSISAVQFVRLGLPWYTIVIRALDLITVVVPPALPATLSIGTSFSIGRLKERGIFCISPGRVNVCGKINVCCFDKTGTLTEDGLDILGVRSPDHNVNRFGDLLEDVYDIPYGKDRATFLHALATCHSLKMVEGQIIGDPLDVKMFEFTKWTLEEGKAGTGALKTKSGGVADQTPLVQTVVRPPGSAEFRVEDALKGANKRTHFLELGVIKTYDFVSSLRRMSVVVKRLKSSSMEIYVKGAPEVMSEICEKHTLPQDYQDLLNYYTRRGYRVIAMAGKSIDGLSWLKAQRMKREQAESGLTFLGFIIFENKIKPGTTPAIQALRAAHLACRMITGDNPLTAVSVARECGLISKAAHVFSPVFSAGNVDTENSSLEWSSMDDPGWKLDSYSLRPAVPPPHHTTELDDLDYSLVITGDVFRWMINYASPETLQRMLVKTQIFARMSPDEKNEIVERLQTLGYTVLMCGDGANDCAALKAADVGISLSEAEASVAAPFTSTTPDIGCVIELIKEGRAALVTSFSCFKFMALYSFIQFTTVTLLYSFASSLGDFQFLYIDLFIIIPVAVTMGRTLPFHRIYWKRPTASLISKKVLASIMGQIFLTSAVQVFIYLWVRSQAWYTPPPSPDESRKGNQLESTNFENTTLFLVSCFQYIMIAMVFSIGPPYRQPMWTNVLLVASIVILTAFNAIVLLSPVDSISNLLNLMELPFSGRVFLLATVVVNGVACGAYEEWGTGAVAKIAGSVSEWNMGRGRRRIRDGKAYKAVEGR